MEKIILTEQEQKLAQLIIRYLREHPDAKHTAEGIARWWILQQRLEEKVERIEKVLNYLVQRGILQEIILPQNLKYYKINTQNLN